MKEITLSVEKRLVYDAVAHTTAYLGGKSNEEGAFERIFATDDDRLIFERYWLEACSACTALMRKFIVEVSEQGSARRLDLKRDYTVRLEMPSSFDNNLTSGISESLRSFFTDYITGKWLELSGGQDAERYAKTSESHLAVLKTALYHRSKPQRQPIN